MSPSAGTNTSSFSAGTSLSGGIGASPSATTGTFLFGDASTCTSPFGAGASPFAGVGTSSFDARMSWPADADASWFVGAGASLSTGANTFLSASPSTSLSIAVADASPFAYGTFASLFTFILFCISQSAFVISRSLFSLDSLSNTFVIAMTTKIKSKLENWLKTANLDRSSPSITPTMKKKRLYDDVFITLRSFIPGYA